jgi:RHS repeat-associated protein
VTQGANVTAESYTLDPFSNRLVSVDDGTATRSLSHNAAGDIEGDDRGADADLEFGYDQAGRLAAVAESGAPKTNALYNAKGERCVMVGGGTVTHSLYDREGRLIAEYDAGPGGAVPLSSEIILDNGDAGTGAAGTWTASTDLPGYLGSDYLESQDGVLDSYAWTPSLPAAGAYAVYARWPASVGRGTAVTYTVTHDGGATEVSLDQKTGGGQWSLLGNFDMTPDQGQGMTLSGVDEPITGETDMIVDNVAPGTSVIGSWPVGNYASPGTVWGANFAYHAAGTGANSFTWPVAVPEADRYQIFARWVAQGNRATDAPYTVHHADGTTTLRVNQEVDNGQWVLLGSFDFVPGAGHRIVLSDDADEYVIADAVRILRDRAVAPTDQLVIDNDGPGASKVGSWGTSTWNGGGGRWGRNIANRASGTGANSFTWTPTISAAGRYTVHTRWPAHANWATNAPFTIHHAGGATTLRLNQEINGGQWVLRGSFDFVPGGDNRVVLTDDADDYVVADAVRFEREPDPAVGEVLVDDAQAVKVGAWTSATWMQLGSAWDDDLAHHPAGGTGAETMTWTPSLPAAGTWRVYARWPAYGTRAPDARYTVHHAGGATTLTVNQQLNPGQWVPLGAFALAPGQGHRVVLSDEGTAGTVVLGDAVIFVAESARRGAVADAVKFVRPVTPAFPVASSTLTREFVTLAGRPLALVEGGPGGESLWVHTDHLGTPQKMTDSGGAVVWDALFTPFGEPVSLAGTAENPQRFPGQRYDAETALHYNYFRDYDPSLGRYVESDPIGLGGGVNTYGYVGGNPMAFIDPFGLKMSEAECGELRGRIIEKANKLLQELRKYDPGQDGIGGFPTYGGNLTKPGGHYNEIADLKRGLKNDITRYNRECRCDDDEGGGGSSPIPRWIDDMANRPVPEPVIPPVPVPGVRPPGIPSPPSTWPGGGGGLRPIPGIL